MKKLLVICAAWALGSVGLHAQVLLNIQITSPDTMVITSTGVAPVTDDSSHTYYDGIDLLGLFTPSESGTPMFTVVGSTLTTGDASTGPVYDSLGVDSYSEPQADLNIYQGGDPDTSPAQTFTFGSPAFALGTSITIQFSGLTFSGIDYGVVMSGYSGSGASGVPEIETANAITGSNIVPIGVYHVTTTAAPEPSTYALMLGGFALLGFRLRRKLA